MIFSAIDVKTIDREKLRFAIDSVLAASGFDSLTQLNNYVQSQTYTSKYIAFIIGYESTNASLSSLNSELRNLGFNEINETFAGIPWGIAIKGKRWYFDYQFVPGINNSVSNDDYKITDSGINVNVNAGFDVLNLQRLQFYPQVEMAWQDLSIDVYRKAAKQDITTANGLISNQAQTNVRKSSLPFSFGLQADYHLKYSKASGGIILGVRYGLTTDIVPGKFKISDESSAYRSSDRMRESYFPLYLSCTGKSIDCNAEH